MPVSDFPVTRSVIDHLDGWVQRLAAPILPPKQAAEPNGKFHWEFRDHSPYALLVAKAVRMVSGIRAALLLADSGSVTESASILRMVSDFATEIIAVGEGIMRGDLTTAQRRFVDQFFKPLSLSLEESRTQEKEFYISREELMKSAVRLAKDASLDGELLRDTMRALNRGYDSYVHGAYLTAMELYDGVTGKFLTRGVGSPRRMCVAKVGVAGKLYEVVVALEFMVLIQRDEELHIQIHSARKRLEASQEESGEQCN
jgi:hypothetical protein